MPAKKCPSNALPPLLKAPLHMLSPPPFQPPTPTGARLLVLDASWYMPAEKRQPFEEFQHGRIPGAIFFDIDAIADPTTDVKAAFSAAASALGLSSSDSIVVYDGKGLFSAARAWWMFRAFGQPHVAVLDGGLPAWRAAGYPVEAEPSDKATGRHKAAATAIKDSYSTKAASNRLLTFNAKLQPNLILFKGVDPEPRAGVRGGSIPGSFNVPFPEVLTPQGQLKRASDLTQAFKSAGKSDVPGWSQHEGPKVNLLCHLLPAMPPLTCFVDLTVLAPLVMSKHAGVNIEDPKQPLAASCGTGVTACVLALALACLGRWDVPVYDGSRTERGSAPPALAQLGRWDVPVYDGSWTEWGSLQDTPVVKAE
ncbi:unnamed protein product [Closterium sp. NIES-64]|nr:unnamed protein product [Closterium sp. NIES-64]